MEAVLRPLAVYSFLLVVVRLSGKRTTCPDNDVRLRSSTDYRRGDPARSDR